MEKMIEDLFNRGYAYDSFREEKALNEIAPISFPGSKTFDIYEGFEADVEFYLEKYNQDVMDGVIGPEVDAVEYIAGRIDEKYPTDNPMQFDSLVREVRALLPRDLSANIREAQIGGTMQYTNGEASGRALAGENADKGIRDITDGPKGRGQAEVDRTGIYVGVPMGLDKTAWENIAAVQRDFPNVAKRAKAFQNAYKNAPEQEKSAMLDWTPENPDMSINLDGQVVDNNINKVMKTPAAPQQQPKAKSSILQKLGFKESLFEEVLNASKLNESCSTSEEAVANIKAEKKAAAAAKKAARESVDDDKSRLFESMLCNESIIRRYLYYCKDCHREYYAGSDEPKPCPCCGKENNISYVEETYWG